MQNEHVGETLSQHAYKGLIFTVCIFILLFVFSSFNLFNLILAFTTGVICSVSLLLYWHGKGGIFFILALIQPLILILFAVLPNFIFLAWVINGFFSGNALLLVLYSFKNKNKIEQS